jgi:hypothetical protein
MFLKLHEIEDPKKKAFILETLRIEFRDIAIEARKVLKCFNKLGSPIRLLVQTMKEPKYLYLASFWDCMKLLKIILIEFVPKIFLVI